MKQFESFKISTEVQNNIVGGLTRRERRALRRQYKSIMREDPSNFNYFAEVDSDGNVTEWREPKWRGYPGGAIQYYEDNYHIGTCDVDENGQMYCS